MSAFACQSGAVDIGTKSEPLIFGDVDMGHPSAVALGRGNNAFCTGTLVSPTVVVTAAHCVDMLVGDPQVTIFFGTDIEGEGTRIGVKDTATHPMWNGELSGGHDVGMLLMDYPMVDIAAIPLSTIDLTGLVGTEVERVGFGIYDAETRAHDGKKRAGTTTITSVPSGTDTFIAGDEGLMTCQGDSGGPAYLTVDGTTYLAGIHSFGITGCMTAHNGDTRVELYGDSFIQPWIQDNDPSCGADLLCAPIGCVDDPDCEPCGPDGTCTEGCAQPDVDCQDRNLGDLCRADSQCTTDNCVVWRDESRTSFCTEACDPASDTCPSGMSCQNIIPLGNVCYYDEAPEGVLGSSCEVNYDCASSLCENGACVYACDLSKGLRCPDEFECSDEGAGFVCHKLPTSSGGCSLSSRTTRWSYLLFGLFILGIRRRRNRRG
jgi:V8-like Glu-specific endopeptidase